MVVFMIQDAVDTEEDESSSNIVKVGTIKKKY
jgi:hypothetical protein